jgi:hypothetical protein
MKTTTTSALSVAAALAVGLGAAGCSKAEGPGAGSATTAAATTSAASTAATSTAAPTASDILEKARTNALAATSAAFTGHVIDTDGTKIVIDYKGTSDGKTSDITLQTATDGKARLITVPEGVFIQADATFWKAQGAPAEVQKAGDKFIKAPGSAGSMAEELSLTSFIEKAFKELDTSKVSDTVTEEPVNGVDCWVLTDSGGKEQGALYVSKAGFEVVRFTGTKTSPGQLDFSRWNEDLGITAPPADQVMPLS